MKFSIILLYLLILPGISGAAKGQEVQDSTVFEAEYYTLRKPVNSGDHQYKRILMPLDKAVRVQVLNSDGDAAKNVPVKFQILAKPDKSDGFKILTVEALSDSLGIAQTEVILGSKKGEYQIAARIEQSKEQDLLLYTFYARSNNWVFMLVIGVLGGLGLFLMGMDMMSEGMKKSAGDKLRGILGSLTKNRIIALGLGAVVTMIIQSSSATSVMLVGFVNSKLMKFKRSIGIILGANIGTTVTAQLIAFKLTDYSLLMIAGGFGLLYFSRKQGYRYVGQSILGFGILFFGMHIMSEAMYPMRSYTPFIELLQVLENPLLGILVGMIFTAILQSSSAFIGIIIVLAGQGLLSLEAAIPLLLGSNIGTAITAFLASINANREAKKVALANAFINIFGMLLFILWIPGFAELIVQLSPKSTLLPTDPQAALELAPRQIANAHTFFNFAVAALLLPVTGLVAKIIDKVLPEKIVPEEDLFTTHYLDESLIDTPALGLNMAKQESLRIFSIVQDMLGDVLLPFLTKQPEILKELDAGEKQVDYLAEEVNAYLTKITRHELESERSDEAFQIMYTVKELEEIADVIGNLLVSRAETWIREEVDFSDEGKKELLEYHILTQKQVSRALEVFKNVNLEKAKRMKSKHKKYRAIASELEMAHYQRLSDKEKKLEISGDTHMEIMTRLRTIIHHATNIARIMIDWQIRKQDSRV